MHATSILQPIWFPIAIVIWLGIAIAVVVINWGWWRPDMFSFWQNAIMNTLAILVGLGVTAVLLLGIAYGISSLCQDSCDQVWVENWRAKMVAMRSADGLQGSISGSVFVTIGHVESAEVYYYYTASSDGGFTPHKWHPDQDTIIYEQDRKDGEVVQSHGEFKNPMAYWIALPDAETYRMQFYVPQGSIVKQYNLN